MRYGLTTWMGDGTDGNEFRPAGVDGEWAVIDLRPDSSVVDGYCFYATEGTATGTRRDFGEDALDLVLPTGIRRAFGSDLGVELSNLSLRGLIAELLILHGTAPHDRTRWNRLKENSRGRHKIVMLGEVLYDAPVIQGVVITESFDTADSDTLGPDLTWTEAAGTWAIVSNKASITAGSSPHVSARADHVLDDNQYAEATVGWGSGSGVGGVVVRASGNSHYRAGRSNGNNWRLHRIVTGSGNLIATGPDLAAGAGLIRIEVDGSTVTGYLNGGNELSTTDTNFTSGVAGLGCVNGTFTFDNFEAGDLVQPPSDPSPFIGFIATGPPYQVPS